ncbi:MAG: hypothetical protein KDI15_13475 [Thiothrix sp.]|nr:hypothetical protein [Thiothrix sp.]
MDNFASTNKLIGLRLSAFKKGKKAAYISLIRFYLQSRFGEIPSEFFFKMNRLSLGDVDQLSKEMYRAKDFISFEIILMSTLLEHYRNHPETAVSLAAWRNDLGWLHRVANDLKRYELEE